MTLTPDAVDPREVGKGTRWTISCDVCHDHLHVGILRPGLDPRLAAEVSGWALDLNGLDFCPLHVNSEMAASYRRFPPPARA